MQTFVFSATLSKDLQQNLKRKARRTSQKGGGGKRASALGEQHDTHRRNTDLMDVVEDLVDRLDFRDPNPEVIDLSPEGGVVAMLKESLIECVASDKVRCMFPFASYFSHFFQDLYLYYFLLRYPGRSLVFVGSIDGIRRLVPLFETLQMPIFPLHSQLQQRQRLKNLDR